mmetsp:Transcript_1453/g.3191  ORF Transcript_1453/g.3191 Transcript_1453/m.3191 type:complete len:1024 (-) Transcript_1453:1638-4709(-)|eukprot:CAMPEP_0202894490 /NCGR_PEP_ID=MMETSP1392-20130828/3893_1 /ASSEMBLY_ACC=CAM_ASM_000868 /TAXON_ID=225041 /ORGANISM="Chlamydomonas chlamydogama, Strain SAG 11-48b" /LENGTH=1023 /DNA_ID=CAMNT_0049579213 /DNA_START=208 /DNA_END=3279 /DNA_ORIENTATION=-
MADPQARPKTKLKATADLKASKSNVVQQAKLLDSAGTAWHAVKYGNLEMITKLFPGQCNVYNKGPVGDNVFHVAMLLNTPSTLAIAKYLVKLYGKTLVNTPYQERKHESDEPGQYEGETALHIAIVNHDFDMVKFLIQAGADIQARAYGSFFQQDSVVYYGEYPLSFAACTGQKDIVSYLKRHGARVNHDRDTFGNTALHMCVYHDQADMYDHLVEYCGASEHVRNNRGQTPLLLAASLGKVEIFQHIYNKRRKVAWAYGPVTSYSLSLHEIDTVQGSRRSFVPSAIEIIVRRGHMHTLDDPLIKTLLTTKWQRFALLHFLCHVSLYTVFVIVQTFLIWLHCHRKEWNSRSREALEIVSIIFACGFLLLEVLDIYMWTVGVYNRRRFMKANPKYCPPLYPIPGEMQEAAQKSKSGFLTRMIKGAVAEGTDKGSLTWEVQPPCTSGSSRPLAEATEPAGRAAASSPPAPAAAGTSAAAQPPAPAPSAGQPLVSSFQRPSAQAAASASIAESAGNGGQQAVGEALGPASSGSQSPGPPVRMVSGLAPQYTQGQHIVDIVSVGLTPALSGVGHAPLFMMPAPAVTSMLSTKPSAMGSELPAADFSTVSTGVQPTGPSGLRATSKVASAGPGAAGGPGSMNLNAASSSAAAAGDGAATTTPGVIREGSMEIGSEKGQEIRNRLRGGGGGDLPVGAKALKRPGPKRSNTSDVEAGEDDRKPLHTGGAGYHVRAIIHSLHGYFRRQAADPILFVMSLHILLTFVHFITWASTYGGVDGSGPDKVHVQEFDDVIVSLIGLSGWGSLLYFARGFQTTGQLQVLLERCFVELFRFIVLFFLANIGFTLAWYTLLNGTTTLTSGAASSSWEDPLDELDTFHQPFSSIGYGMIQTIRFLYGEALYDAYSNSPHQVKKAFGTIYFVVYVACVVLLLNNLFVAMVLHLYNRAHEHSEKVWRLRWASYVLRVEGRMPLSWQQKYRLGEVSYDPQLQMRVYNHVFEVVEDAAGDEKSLEAQVKALEAALERLKKGGKK